MENTAEVDEEEDNTSSFMMQSTSLITFELVEKPNQLRFKIWHRKNAVNNDTLPQLKVTKPTDFNN